MLPEITHLQFLVLTLLLDGEKSGRELRDDLADNGVKKNGPAFYQMMARLEDDKYVRGWYVQKTLDGQVIKERRYEIKGPGIRACEGLRDFYLVNRKLGAEGGFASV